jgi:hypothetical protein
VQIGCELLEALGHKSAGGADCCGNILQIVDAAQAFSGSVEAGLA